MKSTSGLIPVTCALGGNLLITVVKFVAFYLSGSGALLSEAIHSLADTANQSFLLLGIVRAKKGPSSDFSYGHGQERFFWGLVSACGIFFAGAGITIYHGVKTLLYPVHIDLSNKIFLFLLFAFLLESLTLLVALRELFHNAKKNSSLKNILKWSDPTTLAVVMEDAVAVFGVIVAAGCIFLTRITGHAYWDSIGSIAIGLLLGITAVLLINRNRQYLIGKSIPLPVRERIIEILESDPAIEKVIDFKSSILNIGAYHVKCEVEFNGSGLLKEIYRNQQMKNGYHKIQNDYEEFNKFCVEFTDRIPRLIGTRIDKIERKIQKEMPEIKHLDIELN